MANAQLLDRFQRTARVFGAIVTAVGALVFLGWALDNPVLNRLVAGRFIMQLNTGAAFMLLGSLIALFGHAFTTKVRYGINQYTQMTLGTIAAFVLTALGVLFADPERGLMAMISSDTPGGAMARRLYPSAIGIPLILGWIT